MAQLCIWQRISNSIHVVDPATCHVNEQQQQRQHRWFNWLVVSSLTFSMDGWGDGKQLADVSTNKFLQEPFRALLHTKRLAKFIVLSVEPRLAPDRPSARKKGQKIGRAHV